MSNITKGTFSITQEHGVIVIYLQGYVSADLIEKMANEYERLAKTYVNKALLAGIDIDHVTGQDKEARVASRKFLETAQYDKIAIWTKQKLLGRIAGYITKLSRKSRGNKMAFFTQKQEAMEWLLGKSTHSHNSGNKIFLFIFLLFITNALLLIFDDLRTNILGETARGAVAISYFTSACFTMLYLGFFTSEVHRSKKSKSIVFTLFIAPLFIASSNVVLKITNTSLQLDSYSPQDQSTMSYATSVGIIFIAILGLAYLCSSLKSHGKVIILRSLTAALGLITLAGLFITSILDGNIGTSGIVETFLGGMSLSSSLNLLACLYIVLVIGWQPLGFSKLRRLNIGHITGVFIAAALMTITGLSIHDSKRDANFAGRANLDETSSLVKQSIEQRVNEYITAIRGYKSLYAASDEVDAEEFDIFYESRIVGADKPGINALSFIQRVPRENIADYIDAFNANTFFQERGVQIQEVKPDQGQSIFYLVTYIAPYSDGLSIFGFDLATTPRKDNFMRAEQTGEPSASEPINLNDLQGLDAEPNFGFFVTVPVFNKSNNDEAPHGFVNAVFDHDVLFGGIYGQEQQIHLELSENDSVFYSSGERPTQSSITTTEQIQVADRTWKLTLTATEYFGVSEKDQPDVGGLILFGGLFTLITTGLFMSLANSRQRAQNLAELITEDLDLERNRLARLTVQSKALVESIGEGLLVVDQKGVITEVNPEAEKILHTKSTDLVGKWYPKKVELLDAKDKVVPPEDRPDFQTILNAEPIESRSYKIKVNSRVFAASITASPYIMDDHPIGVVIAFRDITKERELENAKDDFIALASHQLRTPATAIKQFIGLLLEGYVGKITAEQKDILNEAYLSNERQIHITQDMLSVAKLESGSVELAVSSVDIKELVERAYSEQKTTIESRKQTMKLSLDSVVADVDQNLLRMVVDNLISNASKYTPEGGKLSVSVVNKKQNVLIIVEDSGVGIAKEDLKKLFGRFSRIKNKLSEKVGGSGLGLFIAQKIVKLHGGNISVTSTPEKGTTFTVELPIKHNQ